MEEFLLNRHDNHNTVLKRAHWRKLICQTNWAGKFLNAAHDPMGWKLKILQPGAGILSWLHVDQANFTISHRALIETLLWGTNCSGTQEVSQCRGLTWFWRIVFQQMAHAWHLGIKSLYLWWSPRMKSNHFPTCYNTIVFCKLDILSLPVQGGRLAVMAKSHLSAVAVYSLLNHCCVISDSEILPFKMEFGDGGKDWNYNQEVTFQFPSAKGDSEWAKPSNESSNKHILYEGQFCGHLAVIWLTKASNQFAMSHDPSCCKCCQNVLPIFELNIP